MRLRKVLLSMGAALAMLFSSTRADATDCPNAIPIPSIPVFNQAVVCGTTDDITATNVTSTCGSTNYYGGLEALYTFTPTTSGAVEISIDGGVITNWTGIFVFDGCPTTAGTNCMGNVTSSAYQKSLTVTLTAGTTYYLMFDTWPSPASPCPATFSIATCAAPTTPAFVSATTTDATVSWTGTATDYEVEYGTVATLGDPGNLRVVASVNPYTITGLNAATTYYWWVRSICGPGDTSAWTSISSFPTACVTVPAPYAQDFNGGTQPACWTNSNSTSAPDATLFWMFDGSNGTPRANTNTRPIGTFAWVDASFPQTATVIMTSPVLDLSSLTSPYLQFDWYKDNQDVANTPNNNLLVEGYDGTAWVTLMDDTSNSPSWRTVGLVLPASFAGITNAQFRFSVDKTLSNTFYDDVLLDEFSVDNTPSCLTPGTVTASNVTSSGADITWVASGSAGVGYEYEVRTSGAAGSGTTGLQSSGTTAFGTNTATISGLTSLTSYTVYVRTDCGSGSYSNWVSVSFLTSLDCNTATPITACGASQTLAVPAGTGVYDMSTATPPGPFGTPGIETLYTFTAPLTGPYTINVTATSSQWVDYYFKDATGGCGANGFAFIDDFFSPGLSVTFNLTAGVTYYILADPEGTAGATQTFELICPATCGDPTLVTASNITTSDADISWTQAGAGTPTQWEISYGTTGTAAGSGTSVLVSTNPYTLTGLSSGVTYDAYVRAICGPGDTSVWSAVTTFMVMATCGEPSAVNASNITATAADIGWTQTGAGTPAQWEISYGPAGTTVGNGTSVIVTTNPASIAGLNQTTNYDVYVRAICGPGDTSTWSPVSSFTTLTSCYEPTAVTTSNVTATSADFSWTASVTPPANGYEYEVRTSGAAGSGATGLVTSGTTAAGVTTATVAGLTSSTAYKIYVRSLCGAGDISAWTFATNFATLCVPPTVTSTTGASSCGTGSVMLMATGTGTDLYWYTNNTTDTVAGMGSPFTTPSISATTTYYVASVNTTNYMGLGNTQIPGGGSNYSANRGIVVQATQSFILNSAQVYSDLTSGNLTGTATLVDDVSGTVLVTTPFSIPAGGTSQWFTMPLNWQLTAGNTYRLMATFTSGSVRRIDGTPVTSGGGGVADYTLPTFNDLGALGTIISGYDGGTSATTYNYFHNIDATSICASTRSAVVATVGGSSTTVNLGNDTTLCSGSSLTLDAGNAGATYVWSTGATTQTITVSTAGTYSVSVTLPGGCSGSDTIVVNTGTAPMVMLGNDTALCAGASLTLDAGNAGATYVWSTGATTQTISVSAAGTYSVSVNNGGCMGMDTIVVSNGQPVVSLGPDASICGSVTLDAGAGGTMYMWSTGAMTQTITVSTPGTYSVAVTNAVGCTGNDTIVISPASPLVVALGNDTTICAGSNLTLNAGNAGVGTSYLWSTGATTQSITTSVAGTYMVTVTNAGGCMGMDTINIAVSPLPMPMLGNDTTICAGASLTLNAGAGTSYLWSNGGTTQTISAASITAGTTAYSVMVMNAAGCVGMDTINVTVSPLPVVALGNDTSVCVGNTITLNAGNAGASYLWSTGVTTQTITVTAGTYSVTVTNGNGCMGMDTINISTATPPMPMLGNDTTICAGSSLTLNAGVGTSYMWNTGANTQSLVVATPGIYSVTVMNAAGCMGMDTINVTVSPLPVVALGNDTMLCPGTSFALDAGNAGSTYLWSTGAISQTIAVNNPGTYSVTVTNAAGCVGMDAINVMPGMMPVAGTMTTTGMSPTFTFTVTGHQNDLLRGFDFGDGTVDTTGASTNGGPTTSTHTYTTSGTYIVKYYVANPCGIDSVMDTVTVTLGVNTVSLEGEVTLAPNPASDRVLIRNTSAQAMKHITVLNAVGAVVRENTPQNGKEQSIDLSGLAAATYMVRIEFDGGAIVVRRLQITQ